LPPKRKTPASPAAAAPPQMVAVDDSSDQPPVDHLLGFSPRLFSTRPRLRPSPLRFPCGSNNPSPTEAEQVHQSLFIRPNGPKVRGLFEMAPVVIAQAVRGKAAGTRRVPGPQNTELRAPYRSRKPRRPVWSDRRTPVLTGLSLKLTSAGAVGAPRFCRWSRRRAQVSSIQVRVREHHWNRD